MHQFSCANASKLVRESSGRSPLPANGLCQPVTLAGEDHNVGMVDQPVYQRRCQAVVPKDGVPLGELKVGCNNQTLAFVAVGDHLKQQFGCILVQRNEANLVHHNQFQSLEQQLTKGELTEKQEPIRWRCLNCGYTYEGIRACDPCPVCGKSAGWQEGELDKKEMRT